MDNHLNALRKTSRLEPDKADLGSFQSKGGGMNNSLGNGGNNNFPLPLGVKRLTWEKMQKKKKRALF